jgi:outer membrane protein TolC
MSSSISSRAAHAVPLLLLTATVGCVFTPRGTDEELARLRLAGQSYEQLRSERELPELPPEPDWRDLLHRAFLANGDLEAAYFEWKAAMERLDIAAGWPNTNLQVGYEYMFSPGRMKAWDRSTVSVGFDPMQNLSLPPKVMAQGHVAFEEARAAGKRFEAAKFALQRQVITAYFDYATAAQQAALAREDEALTAALAGAASAVIDGGGSQIALVEASMAQIQAENEAGRMQAEQRQRAALLNALAALPVDTALSLPPAPTGRELVAGDDELLAIAADGNPELEALAREVAGREDAIELARLQFLPDINPFAAFTGSSIQVAGAAITLATQIPQLLAGIEEAKAMLRRSQALLDQRRLQNGANFAAALVAMRDAERQIALLEQRLLPAAETARSSARVQYEAGGADLGALVEAERAPLAVRKLAAEARAVREARLAEMEELAGVDVEVWNAAQGAALHLVEVQP